LVEAVDSLAVEDGLGVGGDGDVLFVELHLDFEALDGVEEGCDDGR